STKQLWRFRAFRKKSVIRSAPSASKSRSSHQLMLILNVTMKLSLTISAIGALPTTLACLHTSAYITHSPTFGDTMDGGAQVIDNGRVVCSNDWSLTSNAEGHFIFGCLPGYEYSVDKTGHQSWFRNADGFSTTWYNSNNPERYCCIGACQDKGIKIYCTDYHYDTSMFC
ncbi:hypothetical protein B0J11DRAFT_590463, partial [Dendryphion nanum]